MSFIYPAAVMALLPLGLSAQCELAKSYASGAASGDTYAQSGAIWGGLAVIGAEYADGLWINQGMAYVLERQGNTWVEVAQLSPNDAEFDDRFGHSVDIWEERIAIGARYNEDNGYGTGSAYVFDRLHDGSVVQKVKLVPSDAVADDLSGNAVGIHGDRLVVASTGHDLVSSDPAGPPPTIDAGAAYVFEFIDGDWLEVQKLTATNPLEFDYFASDVAISGDRIICGARGHDGQGKSTGAAYVFEADAAGVFQEVAQLVDPNGEAGDRFGASVDIHGDLAVVGSPHASSAGDTSGAAHVFRRQATGEWVWEAELKSDGHADFEVMGASVSIHGGLVAAGAWASSSGGGDASGLVYMFEQDASTGWSLSARVSPGDPQMGLNFGICVDVHEDELLVGARGDDQFGWNAGAAYFFSNSGTVGPSFSGCPGIVSVAMGGAQAFDLSAGVESAGMLSLILGSLSGTSPGFQVDGLLLPLNLDGYFFMTLAGPNSTPLPQSFGPLGPGGEATGLFQLPPGLNLIVGTVVNHAYVVIDPISVGVVFASNPVPVELVP